LGKNIETGRRAGILTLVVIVKEAKQLSEGGFDDGHADFLKQEFVACPHPSQSIMTNPQPRQLNPCSHLMSLLASVLKENNNHGHTVSSRRWFSG